MKPIVWRSVFLGIIAGGVLFFSIMHYYFDYKDISQLIIFVSVSFGILYLAYDQWYKITRVQEMKDSIAKVREQVDENYQAIKSNYDMIRIGGTKE